MPRLELDQGKMILLLAYPYAFTFFSALAFLRQVLLSLFLRNDALAKRGSFGTNETLLQKRQLISVAFILFSAFEGVL